MAIFWVNEATSNRFGNKHLYVVGETANLQSLVDEAYHVFLDRVRSNQLANQRRKNRSEWSEYNDLKDQYGTTNVHENTMIVLTNGALKALEAAITRKGRHASGFYDVSNGLIFQEDGNFYSVNLIAKVKLDVRPCAGGMEVYHLGGVQAKSKIKQFGAADNKSIQVKALPNTNTLGLHFLPTASELTDMKSRLRSPQGAAV